MKQDLAAQPNAAAGRRQRRIDPRYTTAGVLVAIVVLLYVWTLVHL